MVLLEDVWLSVTEKAVSAVKRYMIDPRDNIGLGTIGTNALQFVLASDYDALRLQLSRAREWMQHRPDCAAQRMNIDVDMIMTNAGMPCDCGLTEFLKEVGE